MSLTTAASAALLVLVIAATVLGCVIVLGRAIRRARERRRTRIAAPSRRILLGIAAGDDDAAEVETLVHLPASAWRAVEPSAIALLGKVRGESHATLVSVFERRGAGTRALRDLRRRDPVRRARAAEVLGNLGRRDAVPALSRLLVDPDPDVRVVAARSLGRIGDIEAAQPLLASVHGRRAVPFQHVAHALTRLGPAARDHLVAALDDPHEDVRATATEVLGLIGAAGVAARMERVLTHDPSIEVRVRAARTLGRLGTRTALAPLLSAIEPEQPPALRAAAARALGDLGATAAAEPLVGLLGDDRYEVAHSAARSLLRLGKIGRIALEAAIQETGAGHAQEAIAVADLERDRRQPVSATP